MKFLKLWILFVLPLAVLQSCKKDELEHPEVKTLEVVALSPAKIKVTGEITHKGTHNIYDYGFVYGAYSTLAVGTGTKVSLGKEISEGLISKEIPVTLNYSYDRTIYVRTYLANDKGTAYGDVISVQMPGITTTSFSPTSGKSGDKITIYGNYSNLSKEDVKVSVGGINASINSVSSNQIVFEVPVGVSTSSSYSSQVSLVLTIGGQSSTLSSYFTIKPTFTDFSPKTGIIGSTIYLTGLNLPTSSYYYGSTIRVYFGSVSVTSLSFNSAGLQVTVPPGINTEKVTVAVEVDGIKTSLPGEFTVAIPTISSISPTTVWPGSYITVYGDNFSNYNYYNNSGNYTYATSATLGDQSVNVSNVSSTQLSVYVPNNTVEGDYNVIIKTGPYAVTAAQKLKVKGLSFTNFSPTSGAPGRELTLTGDFNPSLSYYVYFGSNVYNSAYNITSTSMKVLVPGNLDEGAVKLSIKNSGINITSTDNFTVLAPSITSISPTSGVAGTVVTISGSGFTPSTYYNSNTVKFGTTASTTILSATESTIRVQVPSNLTPGAMKISVTNSYGQTVISPMNFTVTNQ